MREKFRKLDFFCAMLIANVVGTYLHTKGKTFVFSRRERRDFNREGGGGEVGNVCE